MTRTEHIAWVKQRALEYVDTNDLQQALASFVSDLGKHPEADPARVVRTLAVQLNMSGHLDSKQKMRDFINGTA